MRKFNTNAKTSTMSRLFGAKVSEKAFIFTINLGLYFSYDKGEGKTRKVSKEKRILSSLTCHSRQKFVFERNKAPRSSQMFKFSESRVFLHRRLSITDSLSANRHWSSLYVASATDAGPVIRSLRWSARFVNARCPFSMSWSLTERSWTWYLHWIPLGVQHFSSLLQT